MLIGSSSTLPEHAAQVRFGFDGYLLTGAFDGSSRREASDRDDYLAAFNWDTSFAAGTVEFGARLRLAYSDLGGATHFGPEGLALGARIQAEDGLSEDSAGFRLTVGLAYLQRLRAPGSRDFELAATFGFFDRAPWELELEPFITVQKPDELDATLRAGGTVAPSWHPTDWFRLGLEVRAGVVQRPEDELGWHLEGALRLGFEVVEGHEIALAGFRTAIGGRVLEETGALLSYRFRWMTEAGFLVMDNDGGPDPEPEEESGPIGTP